MHTPLTPHSGISRRTVVKSGVAFASAAVAAHALALPRRIEPKTYKLGVIGCGGRGTGAVGNALSAAQDVVLHAVADVLPERVDSALKNLASFGARAEVPSERRFVGFDAYEKLLASGVDVVILATCPHFRPMHFEAAIRAGKHVFMEKPVAVDPAGIRRVLAAADEADAKDLRVVAGTQRRHERSYQEAIQRVHDGAIGTITGARAYWNQGGLWMHPRKPEWSDTEWMIRNWLYFTWLSGDHIVEQHVHNLDVVNWALSATPTRCAAMGGRQVRTDPAYGHVFDHFACEFEYPGGITVLSQCRQIDGCAGRVEEVIEGTLGRLTMSPGRARIEGQNPWRFEGDDNEPYTQEHADLYAAIRDGTKLNEARTVAHSTMTAILGREAAYSGKVVTWDQAMKSPLDLSPKTYEFGSMPVAQVATPGKTQNL